MAKGEGVWACGANPPIPHPLDASLMCIPMASPWAQDNGGGFKDDDEAWGAMYDGLGAIMCGSHMPLVRSGVRRHMHTSGHVENVECVACG